MAINRKLLRAVSDRDITVSEFLRILDGLDKVTETEKTELKERIARMIESIYPYREDKEPEEDEQGMDRVPAFLKVWMEREIPTDVMIELADEIWDLPKEQQNAIREQKAKEFAEKYPDKRKEVPLPRIKETD